MVFTGSWNSVLFERIAVEMLWNKILILEIEKKTTTCSWLKITGFDGFSVNGLLQSGLQSSVFEHTSTSQEYCCSSRPSVVSSPSFTEVFHELILGATWICHQSNCRPLFPIWPLKLSCTFAYFIYLPRKISKRTVLAHHRTYFSRRNEPVANRNLLGINEQVSKYGAYMGI